ncbi:hypothetical protein [Trichlorobacter ammonificans]|uniref:DUF2066 domain-containing protein n=1 Tax=Trichlorobacter ammonificans TaxID=2916410 RepID=A0ABM9DBQ1_9BACT|nr:hypothetical protein [Trichlorobacter ammonificans]CAH2032110.1 conserved exported protein of unknown function [Trichlorobacter ammonificans]
MHRIVAFALLLTLALGGIARADQFTATGRGSSEDAAVTNGLNSAIDLAVKQILDEETVKKNKQKIAAALKGKARKLARVVQKGDAEFTGAGYELQVVADVNLKALENEINALGLMQDAMGNPRIMVLYNPNLPQGATLGQTRADLEAFFDNSYGAIVDVLVDKGFDVIDRASALKFAVQVAETHEMDLDTNKAALYGLRYNADLVLYYQTVGIGRVGAWNQTGSSAKIFLRAQLINPSTSRIVASKDVESGSMAGTIQEALYRAAKDVGQKISVVMIDAIKKSWKREKSGAGTFIVVLDGVADVDEIAGFKSGLQAIPGMENIRERESGGGTTTIEIKSGSSADAVKSAVNKVGKQLGWSLKLVRSEGARSTWKRQ